MTHSYLERFNLLNTYKDDSYQKIILSNEKDNHDRIVLINIINKERLPHPQSLEELRQCIDSLIFSEETEKEIILVTLYKKGFPISKYIQYYHPILKARINFIYEYLSKIVCYDSIHIEFTSSLVKESQIIIDDNTVNFNDLIIIDPSFEEEMEFESICDTIHKVIALFLFGDSSISENAADNLPSELKSFFEDLQTNARNYSSLKEIFSDFKSIYLYDLYLDEENSALLMKDVKDSVKSSDGKPLPVFNPINAFGSIDAGHGETAKDSPDENDGDSEPEPFQTAPDEIPGSAENKIDESPHEINEPPIGEACDEPFEPENNDEEIEGVILDDYISSAIGEPDGENVEDEGTELPDGELNPTDLYDFENDYEDLFKMDESEPDFKTTGKDRNNKKDGKVLTIILIAALLGILLTICSKTNLLFFKEELPVAAFEHERLYDEWIFKLEDSETNVKSYEWTIRQNSKVVATGNKAVFRFKEISLDEGEFTVSLRILDENGSWSPTYTNNYYNIVNDIDSINIDPESDRNREQLDSLAIEYAPDGAISKDDTVFRNGSYSLRISSKNPTSESKLRIGNMEMDNNSVISMWILSDSVEPLKVQLIGYNGKEVAFKRTVNFKPSSKNYWELLSVSQETNDVNSLEILFSNLTSRIWVDDLDINSYK